MVGGWREGGGLNISKEGLYGCWEGIEWFTVGLGRAGWVGGGVLSGVRCCVVLRLEMGWDGDRGSSVGLRSHIGSVRWHSTSLWYGSCSGIDLSLRGSSLIEPKQNSIASAS